MIKQVTYYEVYDAFDAEGKGPIKVIGTFSAEGVAEQYAEGNGNYGKDAKVRKIDVFVCDTISELDKWKEKVRIQELLKKFSEEDLADIKKYLTEKPVLTRGA